jgi:probable F420-dependent oxidoreductase
MQIGVVFPQTELGGDVGAVRAYAQGVDDLGFRHLIAYDHVLGADPAVHQDWTHHYTAATTFHEPFVLFGHLAALTGLELVTSVLVLPQRQTALVAKQAAEVDLLSSGRLRLGVGVGWNRVEYEGLGKNFESRGRSLDEQIGLLRRLWTEPSLSHRGTADTLIGVGIAPLPVQRPIPVWIGGRSPAAYRRMGRLADGWFPQMSSPDPEFERAATVVAQAATAAGRDPATIGLEPRLKWEGELNGFVALAKSWRAVGATHAAVDTMSAGLTGVDEHLKVLSEIAPALTEPSGGGA